MEDIHELIRGVIEHRRTNLTTRRVEQVDAEQFSLSPLITPSLHRTLTQNDTSE